MTREEAINQLECIYTEVSTEEDREAIDKAIEALKAQKRGEFKCTECHRTFSKFSNVSFNYCPHCGREVERR